MNLRLTLHHTGIVIHHSPTGRQPSRTFELYGLLRPRFERLPGYEQGETAHVTVSLSDSPDVDPDNLLYEALRPWLPLIDGYQHDGSVHVEVALGERLDVWNLGAEVDPRRADETRLVVDPARVDSIQDPDAGPSARYVVSWPTEGGTATFRADQLIPALTS